jgi:hypothetical protein
MSDGNGGVPPSAVFADSIVVIGRPLVQIGRVRSSKASHAVKLVQVRLRIGSASKGRDPCTCSPAKQFDSQRGCSNGTDLSRSRLCSFSSGSSAISHTEQIAFGVVKMEGKIMIMNFALAETRQYNSEAMSTALHVAS